jgi:hypothetical protein
MDDEKVSVCWCWWRWPDVQVDNYDTLLKRQRRLGWKDTGNRKARRVK